MAERFLWCQLRSNCGYVSCDDWAGWLLTSQSSVGWMKPTQEFPSLPAFHCSECGESGWVALKDPASETKIGAKGVTGFQLEQDPSRIYRGWFGFKDKGSRNPQIVVMSPARISESSVEPMRIVKSSWSRRRRLHSARSTNRRSSCHIRPLARVSSTLDLRIGICARRVSF